MLLLHYPLTVTVSWIVFSFPECQLWRGSRLSISAYGSTWWAITTRAWTLNCTPSLPWFLFLYVHLSAPFSVHLIFDFVGWNKQINKILLRIFHWNITLVIFESIRLLSLLFRENECGHTSVISVDGHQAHSSCNKVWWSSLYCWVTHGSNYFSLTHVDWYRD